jgi:methyl-accepting chemotaxis protein
MDTPVAEPSVVSSGADAGSAGGLTLEQVGAQMAALTSSVNEITSKLNQVSNSLNSQSVNENRSVDTELSGAYDIYANIQRVDAGRDRVAVIAERALGLAVERDHMVSLRAHDHFSALPPVNKPASGC